MLFLVLGTIVVAFDFTMAGITYTGHSLFYALRLVLVSLAAVSCLYFLTLTTPTLDMLGLLKKIRCPWIVIELMVLIYRFIFVLLDIAFAITTAQNCRLGNRNVRTGLRSMGQMLARVLILAMHKTTVLFDAMEARCYDGKMQVINRPNGLEPEDAENFQTIYAKVEGAVSAPTAGMHFSKILMKRLELLGVSFAELTLHPGMGNFHYSDRKSVV